MIGSSGLAIERSPRNVTRVSTVGGSALVRSGECAGCRRAQSVLENVPVTILPDSASILGSASGLPRGRLFRRLYVSHHQGYVVFEP